MQKKTMIFIILLILSLAVSGCSDKAEAEPKEDTTTVKFEDENGEYEVTYTDGSDDEKCPVGTSWTTTNPQTGEVVSMKIVGTKVVAGIEMCYAVYETNTIAEDEVARVEYLWSNEDDETFMWTSYDADGKVLSEMKAMDGKLTITDDEGNVMEFSTNS